MTTEVIEKEFQKVFQELQQFIQQTENSSSELHKLQELWRKCRDNESRLSTRCRDLQTQVAAMKARSLATAAKSKEDKATIASSKKELENAWRIVDEAQEKEQKSREVIQNLQQEVDHLSRTVEHSISLSLTRDRLADLQKDKDNLTEERERLLLDTTELKENLEKCNNKIGTLSAEKDLIQSKLSEAILDSQNKDANLQREIRTRETIEINLRQLQADANDKEIEIQSIRQQNEDMKIQLHILESNSTITKIALDATKKDLENIKKQCEKLQQENDVYHRQIIKQNEESHKAANDIKLKDESSAKLNSSYLKLMKQKDSLYVQIQKQDEQNSLLGKHSSELKTKILELEKERAECVKKIRQDEKVIDGLVREKSAIRQNITKLTESNDKLSKTADLQIQLEKRQNLELNECRSNLEKHQRLIKESIIQHEKLNNEIRELQKKNQILHNEFKSQESIVLDWQRKYTTLQATIRQLETELEILNSKHQSNLRTMAADKEDLSEAQQKIKELDQEKEFLKEDIQSKELLMFQQQQHRQQMEKDVDTLTVKLQHTKAAATKWKSLYVAREADAKASSNAISILGRRNSQQKQEMEKVCRARQKGESLLTKKDNENSSLLRNAMLQQRLSQKYESQNQILVEDIRILKLEIKRLKDENNFLRNSITTFKSLQKEVSRLEKDLMAEKLKNKGLELELENTHNIHRWRTLKGNDPDVYELIQKNRIIQKRLIFKTEQINYKESDDTSKSESESDVKLSKKTRHSERELNMEVKIRRQTDKIKSLKSEEEVHLARIDHLKQEADKMKTELRQAKMQILYLRKSKSLQDIVSASTTTKSTQLAKSAIVISTKMRSLGSGFRIVTSTSA
ncbi:hypothetical protein CHUAL_009326 [Chamberlinius hualienensis]